MLKEKNVLRKIFENSRGREGEEKIETSKYIQRSRLPIQLDLQNKYEKLREKRLDFDFARGKKPLF